MLYDLMTSLAAKNSDLHLNTRSLLDHLKLGVHGFNYRLQVLARVGVLLPRVRVRKEREVRGKVFEVLRVVGQLRR